MSYGIDFQKMLLFSGSFGWKMKSGYFRETVLPTFTLPFKKTCFLPLAIFIRIKTYLQWFVVEKQQSPV